jgi:NitT/TauT family transport system permease protein
MTNPIESVTDQRAADMDNSPSGEDPRKSAIDPAIIQREIVIRRRRTIYRWLLGIFVPIALLALWQLADIVGLVDKRFIPPPTQVFAGMWDGVSDGSLTKAIAKNGVVSLERLAPGFFGGVLAGLLIGIGMGLFDTVRFGLAPVISATFPLPKIAIYPLVIVVFGIGDMSKIVVVAIGTFYMVAINTVSGIIYSNAVYRDVATAFQVPKRIEYLRIVVPAALPSIMAGVRLGFGSALIVLVGAEFVSAQTGIGYYIWNAWQILDIDAMFGGLIVIAIFGILGNWVLTAIERKLIPWSRA